MHFFDLILLLSYFTYFYFKTHKIKTFMIKKHVKITSLMKNTSILAKMYFGSNICFKNLKLIFFLQRFVA